VREGTDKKSELQGDLEQLKALVASLQVRYLS
jgi:hypothetical protein